MMLEGFSRNAKPALVFGLGVAASWFGAMTAAQAATCPADLSKGWAHVVWSPLLGPQGDPLTDPAGDAVDAAGHGFLDLVPGADGAPAFSWAVEDGNLYARFVVAANPVAGTGNQALQPGAWQVLIDSTGDAKADYALVLDGAGRTDSLSVRYQAPDGTSVDAPTNADHTHAAALGAANGCTSEGYTYWLDGNVRVQPAGSNGAYNLDLRAPLAWFSVPGDQSAAPPALSDAQSVRLAAVTGTVAPAGYDDVLGADDVADYFKSGAVPFVLKSGFTPNVILDETADKTSVAPGETVVFTVTAANTGNAKAHRVTVELGVPDHTTFVANSASGPDGAEVMYQHETGGTWDGSGSPPVAALRWVIDEIDPRATVTLHFAVRVA